MGVRNSAVGGAAVLAVLLGAAALAQPLQNPHATPAPVFAALGELSAERLAGAAVLRFDAEVEVAASRAEVWEAWTTTAGLRSWYGPEAGIVLTVGGAFEGQPAGGSHATEQVLCFMPGEMLSLSRAVDPAFARPLEARTAWSVLHFEAQGEGRTRVRYTGFELDLGPDFRESHLHTRVQVMTYTLRNLAARFTSGPRDWQERARGH